MKTCVVLLVSNQTVPNIAFLKWCIKRHENIDLLFVSTSKMEEIKQSDKIWKSLGDNCKHFGKKDVILVDQDNPADIQRTISEAINFSAYTSIIVNITGGTKLMSLASYQLFVKLCNSRIYYIPINNFSLLELYPEQKNCDNLEPLSLNEYISAFGFEFSYSNKCEKNWEYNKNVLTKIESCKEGRNQFFEIQNEKHFKRKLEEKGFLDLSRLNPEYLAKLSPKISFEVIAKTAELFGFDPSHISKNQIRYITGGWFEEFVFQKIMNEKKLDPNKNIALNIWLKSKNETPNEYDVMYIDEKNTIHIIECKSFIDQKTQAELLNNTIYKVQALKSNFGLTVVSHLYTMSIIDKDSVLRRSKDFKIEIEDGTKLCPEHSVF